MLLSDFQIIRPRYETTQDKGLEWFIEAHVQAEKTRGMEEKELSLFAQKIRERIWQLGCKPDRIAKRGHVLADFLHRDWDAMELYRLKEMATGKGLKARIDFYKNEVEAIFERYYEEEKLPPDHLIHVTCTGYVSPSGAQKIVAKKNWETMVTHAYHMGCYGALPALRIARGFEEGRTDIVHTEICCIHSNPAKHEADQLVTQSLFADGFIRYSLLKQCEKPHLYLLGVLEELIPHSSHAMTWDLSDWNFAMTLAKEVPVLIARSLGPFLKKLLKDRSLSQTRFAIHPGGPKIVTQIQERLGLEEWQVEHSLHILRNCGNMSSATLPHIWESMLSDAKIPEGTLIASLAFGPGLTIAGCLLEKRCGS